MVPFTLGGHVAGMAFEPPLGPPGYKRTLTDQRGPYRTQDGYICIIVYTDKQWRGFLKLIGKADLYDTDPRFKDFGTRTEFSNELYPLIYEAMATKTTEQWLKLLEEADVPATPLHTLESIYEDRHLQAIDYFKIEDHPSEGRIRSMSIAEKWSKTQPDVTKHAPQLGEHSVEILKEAGVAEDQIKRMLESGVTTLPSMAR
jgi:crotonobetainyl-CoA:carnitine CoA-transferase CaiB-like acyl-CoA transferase